MFLGCLVSVKSPVERRRRVEGWGLSREDQTTVQVANEVGYWRSAVGVDERERERAVVVVVDLAVVVGASG